MEYILTITKREPNPKYSPKISPYDRQGDFEEPMYLSQIVALETTVTQEEFVAIKKAVIDMIK